MEGFGEITREGKIELLNRAVKDYFLLSNGPQSIWGNHMMLETLFPSLDHSNNTDVEDAVEELEEVLEQQIKRKSIYLHSYGTLESIVDLKSKTLFWSSNWGKIFEENKQTPTKKSISKSPLKTKRRLTGASPVKLGLSKRRRRRRRAPLHNTQREITFVDQKKTIETKIKAKTKELDAMKIKEKAKPVDVDELERLHDLITKWKGVCQQAVEDLRDSSQSEKTLGLSDVLDHFNISPELISYSSSTDSWI